MNKERVSVNAVSTISIFMVLSFWAMIAIYFIFLNFSVDKVVAIIAAFTTVTIILVVFFTEDSRFPIVIKVFLFIALIASTAALAGMIFTFLWYLGVRLIIALVVVADILVFFLVAVSILIEEEKTTSFFKTFVFFLFGVGLMGACFYFVLKDEINFGLTLAAVTSIIILLIGVGDFFIKLSAEKVFLREKKG